MAEDVAELETRAAELERNDATSGTGCLGVRAEVSKDRPAGQRQDVPRRSGIGCNQQQLPRLSLSRHGVEPASAAEQAWATEVNKMINNYEAPIAPEDVGTIVDYLTALKGAK
jgi:hypothetical protein